MVEITYQMMLSTLQTAGILVGIVYYVTIMRNQQKTRELTLKAQELTLETRQAQLFMQIYSQWNTMEFGRQYEKSMRMEWTDFDDFNEKYLGDIEAYTAWRMMARFFEGIGVLVQRGLIDVTLVDDLMSGETMRFWERFQPLIEEMRSRLNWPQAVEWVEYLYEQVRSIAEEQHPELRQ
jgi:hypothetical protein